jgi:hypothetical protein
MGLRKTLGKLYERDQSDFLKNRKKVDRAYDAEEKNIEDIEREIAERKREENEHTEARNRLAKQGKELSQKKRKATAIGIIAVSVIGAIVVVMAGIFGFREVSFQEERVAIGYDGNSEVSLGNEVSYTIIITNDNLVSLRNASLEVRFPAGFSPSKTGGFEQKGSQQGVFSLGDIARRDSVEVVFSGIFLDASDETAYIDTTVHYEVSSRKQSFELLSRMPVFLQGVQTAIDIQGTTEVVSGEIAEYQIAYRNVSGKMLSDVRLIAEVNSRFSVSEMVPDGERDGATRLVWRLGSLEVGASGTILFRGVYDQGAGTRGDVSIRAVSGSGENTSLLGGAKTTTSIIASLLSVNISLSGVTSSGVVESGSLIPITVTYANTSDVGLPSGILTFALPGRMWDTANMQLPSGSFNPSTNVISWRASDIPELSDLSPGERGEIHFSLPVKKTIDISGPADRNFSSELSAMIDSPDALSRLGLENVAGYDSEQVKLLSFVDVRTEAIDVASGDSVVEKEFRVGNEYELSFRLFAGSRYNDISNAEFSFDIPSEMEWGGFLSGIADETVSYDERRRRVVWNIGSVRAGTGTYELWRTIGILLRFTPQQHHILSMPSVISNIRFSGFDTFTGSDVSFSLPHIAVRRIVK